MKKYLQTNENGNTAYKTYGMQQKQFSEGSLKQYNRTLRTRKHWIDNLILHWKQLDKEQQINNQKKKKLAEEKKS